MGEGTYTFYVEFTNDEGELYEQGPCCGDDSDGPFETQFGFTVEAADGEFRVLTLPIYAP